MSAREEGSTNDQVSDVVHDHAVEEYVAFGRRRLRGRVLREG